MGKVIVLIVSALLLGYWLFDSDDQRWITLTPEEEAYEVGYAIGFFDNCSESGERFLIVPPTYDDSDEEGNLETEFQRGYWEAVREERCISSEGRL